MLIIFLYRLRINDYSYIFPNIKNGNVIISVDLEFTLMTLLIFTFINNIYDFMKNSTQYYFNMLSLKIKVPEYRFGDEKKSSQIFNNKEIKIKII